MTEPRRLDQVRDTLRVRHYSLRTEEAYVHWIVERELALRQELAAGRGVS